MLSNLMAAVLLLHAVLGCCVHHGHERVIGAASSQVQASCHKGCSHTPASAGDPAGSRDRGGDTCDEERCDFLRSVQDDPGVKATALSAYATASPFARVVSAPQNDNSMGSVAPFIWHLPVRSHLAKHVLLI